MPTLGGGRHAQRGITFLGNSDQRDRPVEQREVRDDRKALVQHELGPHAAGFEQRRCGRCAAAAGLLVVSTHDDHGPAGAEAGIDPGLDRLEQRHQRALVVDAPTAPDRTVRDPSVERWMPPVSLRAGRDGDDVVVGQQDDG